MKKCISVMMAVVLMIVSVYCMTACDSNEPCTTHLDADSDGICDVCGEEIKATVVTGGYDGSAVEITFYSTMGATKKAIVDSYLEDFNVLYPNITVVHTTYADYDAVRTQISTELIAGNQPNLAYCYPDHIALYNLAGAVETLDGYIGSELYQKHNDGTTELLGLTQAQKDDFIEGYYNEGKQFGDGLMYSLPFSKSTEVLYYNKTFFTENNIAVPTTWDEMEAVCARILEIDPDCIPLGYDSESNWFITMCEQYGSDYTSATEPHYLFNNETNRNFVETIREWHQKGYVTTQSIYGAYTSGMFTVTSGTKSYMSIGSSAGATYQRPAKGTDGQYPFEVGIVSIPQVDPENPKVISQGPSVCIFKSTNEQEELASWLLLKYLTTSVEFQAEFAIDSGYVPVLKSVSTNAIYSAFLDSANGTDYIAALSAKVCIDQQAAYYTSPAFSGSSKAREQVGILLAAAMTAQIPTTTTVDSYILRLFQAAIEECEY